MRKQIIKRSISGATEIGLVITFLIVAILGVFSNKNEDNNTNYSVVKETTSTENIKTITEPEEDVYYFGILPLRSEEEMRKRFEPTVKHIKEVTGLNIQLKLYAPKKGATSYTDIVRDVSTGKIQFAYLAPVTCVQANGNGPVVPFACAQKKGSPIYYGHMAVKIDSAYNAIDDLKDKKVCGSSKSSTSGNLMPSAMMKKNGIDPTTFFAGGMTYPGSHDKAAQQVLDGEAEACFINEATFNKFNKNEKVLRSIWRHDAVPEFPFCVNLDSIPVDVLDKVKAAIYSMHESNLEGVKASNPKYDKWVAIELEDYTAVKFAIEDVYAGMNFYDLDKWGK